MYCIKTRHSSDEEFSVMCYLCCMNYFCGSSFLFTLFFLRKKKENEKKKSIKTTKVQWHAHHECHWLYQCHSSSGRGSIVREDVPLDTPPSRTVNIRSKPTSHQSELDRQTLSTTVSLLLPYSGGSGCYVLTYSED